MPEPEPCKNHEMVITFFKCESIEEMRSKLDPAITLLDKYEKAYDVVYTNFVDSKDEIELLDETLCWHEGNIKNK